MWVGPEKDDARVDDLPLSTKAVPVGPASGHEAETDLSMHVVTFGRPARKRGVQPCKSWFVVTYARGSEDVITWTTCLPCRATPEWR